MTKTKVMVYKGLVPIANGELTLKDIEPLVFVEIRELSSVVDLRINMFNYIFKCGIHI